MRTGTVIFAALSVLVMPACNKNAGVSDRGYLSLNVSAIDNTITDCTRSAVSDFCTLPETEDLMITIKDSGRSVIYSGRLEGLDQSESYLTGGYTVSAYAGAEGEEGPQAAYFYGERDFTIVSRETAEVRLSLALANTVVKIECTDNFRNYFSDIALAVETGSGNSFDVSDGSVLFVEAFRFCIKGSMTTPQGRKENFETWFEDNINPKSCYAVRLDAANVGSGKISISFNDTVETVDLGEVDVND